MIKFFRTFRENQIKQSRPFKYLLYALGEIILVVIGILLALQVNDWNDERTQRKKEKEYLTQIHNEFLYNRKQLDTVFFYHNQIYESTAKILLMTPINLKTVNRDTLSELLKRTVYIYTYNPQQSTISSLENTSTFSTISNTELRGLLQNWKELVKDYSEAEIDSKNFMLNHYWPYLRKRTGFKNWNRDLGLFDHPKVKSGFLEELEFENLVHARNVLITDVLYGGEFDEIKATINRILELTVPDN